MKSLKSLVNEARMIVKFSDILKTRTEQDYKKIYGQLIDYFEKNAEYTTGYELPKHSKDNVYVVFIHDLIYYGAKADEYEIKWKKTRPVNYDESWWTMSFDKGTKIYTVPKELLSDIMNVMKSATLDPTIAKDHWSGLMD
jgi:hypothetical protein